MVALEVHDEEVDWQRDLRGRQAEPFARVHGVEHRGRGHLNVLVDGGHRLGRGAQRRMRILHDLHCELNSRQARGIDQWIIAESVHL